MKESAFSISERYNLPPIEANCFFFSTGALFGVGV
jgi:hypothetical protein